MMMKWCTQLDVNYHDVIMGAIASPITSLTIVYSIVYSDVDQREQQSSVSPAFVRGIHQGPVNSPHKWPVMRKMFPFDDVIMCLWEVPYYCSRPPIKFRGHTAKKNRRFSGLQLQFEFTNGYEMMHKAWSSIEEVPYCFSRSSIKFQGRG